ncbi:cytochrome c oxidase subunit II [Candidatus Pyrohabitans sp.]
MTINKYEKAWLIFSAVMVVAFLSIIGYFSFVAGLQTPQEAEVIDPLLIGEDARFSQPRVEEVIPGELYNVYMVGRMWSYSPRELQIPRGAYVKFYITSPDVQHGFQVVGTNVQANVIPGYVTVITARFEKPGEYLIVCNEYCGRGHQFMRAKLIVTEDEG